VTKTCTILGPFAPADFNDSTAKTAIQTAVVNAISSNDPISVEPFTVLGNVFIVVATS